MFAQNFQALVLTERDGKTHAEIRQLSESDLPREEVLVAVDYSTLNYKDALAVTGRGKIVRQFPMVPGVDLAGRVVESASPDYKSGDAVLLTGWSVGERYWGGYSQYQRVKAGWLTPLPAGLSSREAMAIGTAGFTAMLCVLALEEGGVRPDSELPVLVTGAAGGVGSVAVALLSRRGYKVVAGTGRAETHDYLRRLGASDFIGREELSAKPRPLEAQRWAGAVDTVGSAILARVLAETVYGGTVAACGLAGGSDLPATVMPFILRGVRLQGVDSVMYPADKRPAVWRRLAEELPRELLAAMSEVIPLSQVPARAEAMLAGQVRGRLVVDVNA